MSKRKKTQKTMYIVAGCNGAGKSTAFRMSLSNTFQSPVQVNPDQIARALCPEEPERVERQAARISLLKIDELLKSTHSFSIETTLATRTYLNFVMKAHENGFKVALYYYWLNSPELAIARVAQRVQEGGHNVKTELILRRYAKSIEYLKTRYMSKVDSWKIFDNSSFTPKLIAEGRSQGLISVFESLSFKSIAKAKRNVRIANLDSIYAIGIEDFTEKILKEKAYMGQNVVYSVDGEIITLSASDAKWLYYKLRKGLKQWEVDLLSDFASKGEDMQYQMDNQILAIPATAVLDLFKRLFP